MRPLYGRKNRRSTMELEDATVREFSGGLNVIDNDLNLSSRYAKVLDNLVLQRDGSIGLRYGTKLFADLGAAIAIGMTASGNIQTTNTSNIIKVEFTSITGSDIYTPIPGHTINIWGVAAPVNGIPFAEINTNHVVVAVDLVSSPKTFSVQVSTNATSTGTVAAAAVSTWSNLNQNFFGSSDQIVDGEYFQDYLIVTSTRGEIAMIDSSGKAMIIWNEDIADSITNPVTFSLDATSPVSTTNLSSTVEITFSTPHGLTNGTTVTFAGLTDTGGIVAANLNIAAAITVVSPTVVSYTAGAAASSTATGGGSVGTASWDESPGFWSATSFVCYEIFNGELTVHNGIDKPLLINIDAFFAGDSQYPCNYLVDLATGSNVNVPIGRYAKAINRHLIIAGDPVDPTKLHISNIDTSGTWYDDPAPNNGTYFDIGSIVPGNSQAITGMEHYRDALLVYTDDTTVAIVIGEYDASNNHIISVNDVIEKHGTVTHRSLANIGNDVLSCDVVGVPSISRALFTGALRPDRASELVDPDIQEKITALTVGATADNVFALYNIIDGQYMLFIPNNSDIDAATETICYVYTQIDSLKIKAWARFRGWKFRGGTVSKLGILFFFGDDAKVYYYTSDTATGGAPLYADFIDDPDIAEPSMGDEIEFTWEFPWSDFQQRFRIKQTRHIGIDSSGQALFTVSMFVDNLTDSPQLSMQMSGGDSLGFGEGGFGDGGFGGYRRTAIEQLYAWPARFKIAKLKFTGSTRDNIQFISITLSFLRGSIRR